ncbi:MAG: hypothetical protein ACK2UK_13030, partial [Candidatus Promineifilaceae bacterium]
QRLLYGQINLRQIVRDGIVVLPELIDFMYRSPFVLNEALRFAEKQMKSSRENPLGIIRTTVFGSVALLSGAIVAAAGGPTWLWAILMVSGFAIASIGLLVRR